VRESGIDTAIPVAVIKRAPPNRTLDCLVDTGSHLPLLIPHEKWQAFADDIQWLSAEETANLPPILRESEGAAGGVLRYRFGVFALMLCDPLNRRYPTYPRVLAAFADPGTMRGNPIIGLGGGLLDEYDLVVSLKRGEAWLKYVGDEPARG